MSAALADILGDKGLTGFDLGTRKGRREGAAFESIINAADTVSRAKATASQIGINGLPGSLGRTTRATVKKVKKKIKFLKNKYHTLRKGLGKGNAVHVNRLVTSGLDGFIRTVHYNDSGWLPDVDPDQADDEYRADPTDSAALIQKAWYTYAQGDSAYIEFTIDGAYMGSDGWRLVYDYINNRYYLTLHYHWHKGYNPFFLLTGT